MLLWLEKCFQSQLGNHRAGKKGRATSQYANEDVSSFAYEALESANGLRLVCI